MMTDTERLDAIGAYGLCLVQDLAFSPDTGYAEQWIVVYWLDGDITQLHAPNIRDAVDTAVEHIKHQKGINPLH